MSPPLLGLRHVALTVRDVERSLVFYTDVMGLALEWRPDPENAYLTSGSDNLALHQAPEGRRPDGPQTLDHIGFVVPRAEDVDAWAEQLTARGVEIAAPPRTHRDGARSLYCYDPDRILIQIIHHPPISGT